MQQQEGRGGGKVDLLIQTRMAESRILVNISALKTFKPKLHYKDSIKEPRIANLNMIGTVGKFGVEGDEGKILRALRFKNITDISEDTYNLPPYILMAMIAQESSGVDLLTKPMKEGGFGFGTIGSSVVLVTILIGFIIYTVKKEKNQTKYKLIEV